MFKNILRFCLIIGTLPSWQDLYSIATKYFRLVDPEAPVFWFDKMPDDVLLNSGYKTNLPFIEGHVINIKTKTYFDLVFKLVKSMVDNYSGGGVLSSERFRDEIKLVNTEEQLIKVVRANNMHDQGFVISTQVPSLMDADGARHDGVMILLSGNEGGKVDFVINHMTTKERAAAYSEEIRLLLNQLYQQVRKKGLVQVEFDAALSTILSMAYYMYNLMPLTRGSGVVTYSVLVGVIMALGREVTGKIPPGKLLEMEALLSGAPDAFVVVTQQWLNVNKSVTAAV